MKKWLVLIGGVILVTLGVLAFNSKFYYPELPIESVSKKEVLQSIENSTEPIVKIGHEKGYEWFITEQGQGAENLKRMISEKGWGFKMQEGAGYFFEKNEETLIVETRLWTGNYVIVQVPEGWRE